MVFERTKGCSREGEPKEYQLLRLFYVKRAYSISIGTFHCSDSFTLHFYYCFLRFIDLNRIGSIENRFCCKISVFVFFTFSVKSYIIKMNYARVSLVLSYHFGCCVVVITIVIRWLWKAFQHNFDVLIPLQMFTLFKWRTLLFVARSSKCAHSFSLYANLCETYSTLVTFCSLPLFKRIIWFGCLFLAPPPTSYVSFISYYFRDIVKMN